MAQRMHVAANLHHRTGPLPSAGFALARKSGAMRTAARDKAFSRNYPVVAAGIVADGLDIIPVGMHRRIAAALDEARPA